MEDKLHRWLNVRLNDPRLSFNKPPGGNPLPALRAFLTIERILRTRGEDGLADFIRGVAILDATKRPHLMDAMEDQTDAEKARLVLEVARIPGGKALDDATAASLGDDLSWAAIRIETYRIVTSKELKTDQIVFLEEIARTGRTLFQLLVKNDSTVGRLELFYSDPFQPRPRRPTGPRKGESVRFLPNLSEMQGGLEALADAADEALATIRKRGGVSTPRINTPMEYCVFEMAKIFKKYGGADPGTSSTINDKKGGPFVRFVHEAARQFGFQSPAGATIAAALRKRKSVT